ncbi:MAG: aldo/keto reductase [Verrucomicrobia bacterium]|nr:aldo/keto reductase [Verrucomicrobiota bacterium]
MKTQPIGSSALLSTRLAYGCMRLPTGKDRDSRSEAAAAVMSAFEAGFTLFDHADIYGHGGCEQVFGDILKETSSIRREAYLIATKCGIRFADDPPGAPHRYDFSKKHIIWSCEQSLKRLSVETIDIYQLHRPDLLMNPDEVAEAFSSLKQAGKVRFFGVSNFSPSFTACLQSSLDEPLVVNQVEIHPGRLDCFYDGTLDQCIAREMTPLSWSPLGGGWLGSGGKVPDLHPRRDCLIEIQQTLDQLSRRYEVTRTVLALAWLLKHPSGIIPIIGSCNPDHIRESAAATEVKMGREDWYSILNSARGAPLP